MFKYFIIFLFQNLNKKQKLNIQLNLQVILAVIQILKPCICIFIWWNMWDIYTLKKRVTKNTKLLESYI